VVTHPSLRAGNAGCIPPHPGRTWTGVVHRPIAIRQFSKTPLLRAWWAARDSNPIAPLGENGVTARQRTIRSYRPFGNSARIRTRTRELWRLGFGGSDAPVTPRCRCCFTSRSSFRDRTSA